jgi:hypothetical protein
VVKCCVSGLVVDSGACAVGPLGRVATVREERGADAAAAEQSSSPQKLSRCSLVPWSFADGARAEDVTVMSLPHEKEFARARVRDRGSPSVGRPDAAVRAVSAIRQHHQPSTSRIESLAGWSWLKTVHIVLINRSVV